MTDTIGFYSKLTPFSQFQGIFDLANYTQLPDEWVIVITDIEGSTLAIQQGNYRHVNAVGAASIIAIFNALKPLSIPFVFGGDGATLCIHQSCIPQVQKALIGTKMMAEEQFSLALRCGIVPYSVIKQSDHQVLVGKCQVSKGYCQAAFAGTGLAYAEKLVKNDQHNNYCFTADDLSPEADFSGFECRWKDIPSPHQETISLLVMSIAKTTDQSNEVYLQAFNEIQKIYGKAEVYRPVQQKYLELTTNSQDLQHEVNIRVGSKTKLKQVMYAKLLPWKVKLGRYLMSKGKYFLDTDWGKYKESLVNNTDFRKFDENLRMVISGNAEQRTRLTEYLQKQYLNKQLVYGLHVSDRALMTCVISDYNLNHIHFVDGADGGYAMAAKAMKEQLKVKTGNNKTTPATNSTH